MLQKNTPPYITILIIINVANIFFSSTLIPIFLAGVVFNIFTVSMRKGYNNILFLSIVTFLILENTQGVKLFSLTIIALAINFLIIPKIKQLFSSDMLSGFIYIFAFYILFYFSIQISNPFDLSVLFVLLANFVIDILIVGFILWD